MNSGTHNEQPYTRSSLWPAFHTIISTGLLIIAAIFFACNNDNDPPAEPNYGLQFDAIDDIVTIPDINNSLDLDSFTIEAWVYRDESDENHMLVSKSVAGESETVNSNFWLWIKANNKAEIGWELPNSSNVAVEGETEILPETWYHIAGVRVAAANTLAIYVNGILDSQAITTSGMPNTQNINLYFGNTPGVGNELFKGRLDEVRIWRIPIDEATLKAQMHLHLSGREEGLVGLWKLNEGKGQIVFDETENVNHGHLGEINGLDNADPNWIHLNDFATRKVTTGRTRIIF